jgi:hypothetical protein
MNTQHTSHEPYDTTCERTGRNGPLVNRLKQIVEGGPGAIEERLGELEDEWTTGRASKATAAVMIVSGLALSAVHKSWWLLLSAGGGVLLLPYLFGRRSPLGAGFHRLGLRTGQEIEQEKVALKLLRGDFHHLPAVHEVVNRDDICRMEGEGGIVYEPPDTHCDAEAAAHKVLGATHKS